MSTESNTQPSGRQIPFYLPDVGEEEIQAVAETIRSGWLTIGPKTLQFEQEFAAFVGAKHAIAVNSCTAALHLAFATLRLEPGDEVITSTLTFAATGATILHAGGTPVLADVSCDTLNIDPDDVRRKLSPRTRAIVPVHFAGHPAAMDELCSIAAERGIPIIEDAAHSLPAEYRGAKVGSIGKMTAFSFYATKNLSTGEGGMLTTDDDEVADTVRCWRLHGMSRDAWRRYSGSGSWRYDVSYPGFKYNMTDTAAAMGLVQLRRLPDLHARRIAMAKRYHDLLADVPGIRLPSVRPEVVSGWHLYAVRFDPVALRITRDEIIERLKESGIGTSVHFIPLHMHSYYRDRYGMTLEHFPVASEAGETLMSLPFHTKLSDEDQEYIAEKLAALLRDHRS